MTWNEAISNCELSGKEAQKGWDLLLAAATAFACLVLSGLSHPYQVGTGMIARRLERSCDAN